MDIISPTHIYHPTELVQDQWLVIYDQAVPTNEGVDDQTDQHVETSHGYILSIMLFQGPYS